MKILNTLFVLLCCILLVGCGSDSSMPDPKPDPDPTPKPKEKTYYVSPAGSDENMGTSSAFALKTFDKVLTLIKPGDVVSIMPGNYQANAKPILDLLVTHSGEAEKYITFKAHDPNNKPVLVGTGNGVWNAVNINASYIIIDGLELAGDNARLDSLEAYNIAYNYKYNTGSINWSEAARFNTNGMNIGGPRTDSKRPHHIIIRNCVVHDFPGGGIGALQADYLTFENNIVYNNAWYTMYACSGISILNPVNTDTNTGYKNIIRNNICYNNRCKIPWASTVDFRLSDGNGIIIDINTTPYEGGVAEGQGPYLGRTLVENNLSFYNGGSGIHCFKADHVDIIHNTAYHNTCKYKKGEYGEIWSNNCKDVNLLNNILYARPGSNCNQKTRNATEVYDYNIYYGGDVMTTGPHDKIADPLFMKLSTDRLVADFHLTKESPAIGYGVGKSGLSGVDIEGNSRSQRVDVGAYQYMGN